MRLFKNSKIDFLRIKWPCIALSLLSIAIGTVSLIHEGGPRLGVDFTGGTQIVYAFSERPSEQSVRDVVERAGIKVSSVQRFDKPEKNQILLRVPPEKAEGRDVSKAVTAALSNGGAAAPAVLSSENVGPQVGRELRGQGVWAIVLSWAAMLAYIAFRFRSASFGSAAVLALIHDTWTTLGICSLLGTEISLTVVAAFLTLIGYSVNDTVVVFDRIRESRQKSRREPLSAVVNRAINETLSRTILTSGATLLAVLALYVIGGEALHGFALVMLIGIVVGTYSSIFVAAPLVVVWEEWKARRAGPIRAISSPA